MIELRFIFKGSSKIGVHCGGTQVRYRYCNANVPAHGYQRLRNQRVTLLKGRCLAFSQFKNILFQPPALRYDQFLRYQTRPLRFISLGNYKCLVKVN